MNTATPEKRVSTERFFLLVRNRLLDDAPAFAVAASAVFAVGLLFLLIRSGFHFGVSPAGSSGGWPFLIFIGGVFLSGRAFERMHDGRAGTDWLLLPAAAVEKYASALAVYLIVYPIAAAVAAVALSASLSLIALALGRGPFVVWNPLSEFGWNESATYCLFSAFAMAGSARFRKIPLIKAAALVVGWGAFLAFAGMCLLFIFGGPHREFSFGNVEPFARNIELTGWKMTAFQILSVVTRAAAFAFAVLYGYFRVAEKEAVDEVQ